MSLAGGMGAVTVVDHGTQAACVSQSPVGSSRAAWLGAP